MSRRQWWDQVVMMVAGGLLVAGLGLWGLVFGVGVVLVGTGLAAL